MFLPRLCLRLPASCSAPWRLRRHMPIFRLCNNHRAASASRSPIPMAQIWVSEGWWNIKPSVCETLLRGPLAAQFYYVYAMDERGGEWKGKAFMCTRDREFRIDGREDCFVRGFDRSGFFEVDTGKDAKNWTVQLTDPAQQAAAHRAGWTARSQA